MLTAKWQLFCLRSDELKHQSESKKFSLENKRLTATSYEL